MVRGDGIGWPQSIEVVVSQMQSFGDERNLFYVVLIVGISRQCSSWPTMLQDVALSKK
jgi:hypothetical protein